jgi:hypothetical protein
VDRGPIRLNRPAVQSQKREVLRDGDQTNSLQTLCMTQLLLKRCDVSQCEGMCCYDGVYLEEGEEERIHAIVKAYPDFFSFAPPAFITDGTWRNRVAGRKIDTAPHRYQNPHFPAHFSQTRCVMSLPDARCALQVLATRFGKHPWTYKPKACWMHPLLREGPNGVVPPPPHPEDDPDCIDASYPGFVTYTLCGRHQENGSPWKHVLAEELAYYQQLQRDDDEHAHET